MQNLPNITPLHLLTPPTSPSPAKPSGPRPTRTTPPGPRSIPWPATSPHWTKGSHLPFSLSLCSRPPFILFPIFRLDMRCSLPLRSDQTLFRDREVFGFTHLPDNHRDGADRQESKSLPEYLEFMRMLQDELIGGKIRRSELQGCSTWTGARRTST